MKSLRSVFSSRRGDVGGLWRSVEAQLYSDCIGALVQEDEKWMCNRKACSPTSWLSKSVVALV